MSDFSEIESELKTLQPSQPSDALFARVENAMTDLAAGRVRPTGGFPAADNMIRPDRFRVNWISLGLGLAAAALLLIFARLQFFETSPQPPKNVTAISPAPARSTSLPAAFVPAGATQVVYHTRDEGLVFPAGSEQPVRRLRSRVDETLQWQNPATGASLAVSYPTEQIELIPVSGQ